MLNTWGLGSFARDWTCLLHWKHRLLSTRPPGKALPEDVNSLFYLKTKQNCCLLFPLSVYLSLCVNTIFLFNSYHVEDFNKMFSDPNCPYLLNSETLKTLWKCLSGASAWWQGSFTVTFFLLEKEWPTVVSIVNCWSFLWFKDSCSLLTRKAQAWLAGSWCVWGTWVGGLLIQSADLHLFPLFPWRLLALPFARWGVPKSRTSELQSLLLVLGRHSH